VGIGSGRQTAVLGQYVVVSKGTMSEAELHIIRARLRGGILNKARRGELEIRPPVGLVYRSDGKIVLDPNSEVQSAIRMLFETFDRTV
jgi:DNA invertase Pin-like site-specific DNA recombinase